MLSIEVCRKFCRAANLHLDDEEVENIKDFLYQLAQLSWQGYLEQIEDERRTEWKTK